MGKKEDHLRERGPSPLALLDHSLQGCERWSLESWGVGPGLEGPFTARKEFGCNPTGREKCV